MIMELATGVAHMPRLIPAPNDWSNAQGRGGMPWVPSTEMGAAAPSLDPMRCQQAAATVAATGGHRAHQIDGSFMYRQ